MVHGLRVVGVVTSSVLLLACGAAARAEDPVSFNRDIRPILSENCFQCHGPDPDTREAGLRLDTRDGAFRIEDGHAAIVPGKPEQSELIARITSDDESLQMPPAGSEKRLTDRQRELLRKWIAAGAQYESHWAFQPVRRADVPQVAHTSAVRNPIDAFVIARLEKEGIEPSPEADRYTLIRRVYLDFLGLPPTVEQVDEFVNDNREDAYERMVDRVLASPRFGERWGRHWLDQARYADSHGYTNDNARVMWPYRDWVIDAFNRDLPFDRFTIEQIAGDLLPEPSTDQLIATGFHRNTLINSEGGTKADQFRDEQIKDRVDTTGGVWLGLTVGCAKCHTHKFDPITQHEYYSLYSFFNSTQDRNSIAPTIKAPTDEQRAKLEELDTALAGLKQQLAGDPGRAERQQQWEADLITLAEAAAEQGEEAESIAWTIVDAEAKAESGATLKRLDDGSYLASGSNVGADEYKLTVRSPLTKVRSVRLEALTHESLPKNGPGRAGNGNFVLSEIWFRTGDGQELRFNKAAADHSQKDFDVVGAIDNKPETGWAINGAPEGGPNHNRVAWFVLPTPLEIEKGHALTFTLQFHNGNAPYNLGRLRLSISPEEWIDAPSASELAPLARIPREKRTAQQQKRLDDSFLRSDPKLKSIQSELEAMVKQREDIVRQIPSTMIMRELDKPPQTHMQVRGDFLRPGDEVAAAVPAVLPQIAPGENRLTRLNLAKWLVSPDNPLTPRVRVNRMWMRMFGTGLVRTENDFGTQGTLPTHPELLDWLASEFIRLNWSTKAMLRTIATSATYRQSSHERPELATIDAANELLARQNRIRVEGEIVRDVGLAISGLLSDRIGGPSVHPPQPEGVYAFTQRVKKWDVSTGEDRYRRGIYTFFYRSAPYPMLTTFDAPRFNQTCTRRERSNTPLQALTVANDEAMFEMAQALAVRGLKEVPAESADAEKLRLRHLFRICMARPPRAEELHVLTGFFQSQQKHFTAQGKAAAALAPKNIPAGYQPAEVAAWVATARVLMNLDEVITRE